MILTTHAVAGATTAILLRQNPWLALLGAFLSHFLLDMIPHWHYPIRSLKHDRLNPMNNVLLFNGDFAKDVIKTGIDSGIGVLLAVLPVAVFFPERVEIALLGALAGILPDFLQLLFHIFPRSPLYYLQWFHQRIHARIRLKFSLVTGIGFQTLLVILFLGITITA